MIKTMNILFTNRATRFAIITVALFTLLSATACGGKAKKADRAPSQQRVLQSKAPAPTGEVLKDSPCGNPDWAKPPGSTGPEPVDADFRATKRKKSDATTPAKKSDDDNQPEETEKPAESAD